MMRLMMVFAMAAGLGTAGFSAPPYIIPLPTQGTNAPHWVVDPTGTNLVTGRQAWQAQNTNWAWAEQQFAGLSWLSQVSLTTNVTHGSPTYGDATATIYSWAVATNTATHVDLAIVGRGRTNAWTGRLVFGFCRETNTVTLTEATGGDQEVLESDSNMDAHTLLDGTNVLLQVIGAPGETMTWTARGQVLSVTGP